jgi:hypothetical protein
MSIEDVARRLKEDRLAAQRELLRSKITKAFDAVRVTPVAEPMPKTEPEILCELIIEAPAAPPRPPSRSLTDVAAPLLARLANTSMMRRRPNRDVWTIEDLPTEAPEELFRSALSSLGYAEIDARRTSKTEETVSKKGWWQK